MNLRSARMFVAVLGVALAATSATAQPPVGAAKYVPRDKLLFLLEFDGLDAHDAAWRRSAAYKVLNETKFGALLEDVVKQGIQLAAKGSPPPAELLDTIKRTLRSGGAIGVWGNPKAGPPSFVTVLRSGGRNGTRQMVERAMGLGKPGGPAAATSNKLGRSISRLDAPGDKGPTWWTEGDDLVLTQASDVDAVLSAVEGRTPNALTHPVRTALAKTEDGFQPILRAFLDISTLPIPPDEARKSGLSGLKRLEYRWGVQEDALMSVFKFVAPAPRSGFLAILDGATFDKNTLPPLPADLHGFTVLSLKPSDMVDKVIAAASAMDPAVKRDTDQFFAQFSRNLGFDLRKDLLANLGPKMAWAVRPTAPNQPADFFFIAQVKNPTSIAQAIDRATPTINAALAGQRQGRNAGPTVKLTKTGASSWTLDAPPAMLAAMPNLAGLKPTIRIGRNWLILAPRQDVAQKLAATVEGGGKGWTPKGDYAALGRRIPSNMVLLSIEDPRDTFPQLIENLPTLMAVMNGAVAAQNGGAGIPIRIDPTLVATAESLSKPLFPSMTALVVDASGISLVSRESIPSMTSPASASVAVALLLPAVQAAREAARRAQCVNNLKQIGLAMHNHYATFDSFPRHAIVDKNGKPLLSWRVAILPYIEQEPLYRRFHLDEPWDSPHNKALIPLMPKTYECPSRPAHEPGTTHYQCFQGQGTLMDPAKATRMADITDGTSFTLLTVEAAKPVVWTKPDDIKFDPAVDPGLQGAGSSHPGGFNALMCDGSVRFLTNRIDAALLKAMITRNGGEPIRLP